MDEIHASKRVLIAALIAVVVIIAWYQFIYREQHDELVSIEREIEKTEALVTTWVEESKSLPDYKNRYVALETEKRRILSQIPSIHQVDRISRRLIDLGRQYRCEVTYLGIPFAEFFSKDHSIEPSGESGIVVIPLQLRARGDFASLGTFIEVLSDLPFFTAFGELELARSSRNEGDIEMNFSMMIFLKRDDPDEDLERLSRGEFR